VRGGSSPDEQSPLIDDDDSSGVKEEQEVCHEKEIDCDPGISGFDFHTECR
jgi:hypothetical protein